MKIKIVPVEDKKGEKAFLEYPWQLLKKDPQWVPPLKLTLKDIFNPRHPFYKTSELKKWLAVTEDEGKIVGRIAAIVNQTHNQFHQEKCGHFGFFDCADDQQVAQALFAQAENYLKDQGMEKVMGPMNPSTNYECGVLVEGLEDPPQIMMTYNPAYYEGLIHQSGYQKSMDLLAYQLSIPAQIPERITKISEKIAKSNSITWRTIRKSHWKEDMQIMQEIYNEAWERNWGFVPMSPAEFDHLATSLKSICTEDLVIFVEVKGRPAGFIVALPDYNQIFKKIPSGKLLPFGLFKILTGQKKITRARVITLGIRSEYRPLGISTFLYTQMQKQLLKVGQYHEAELSWILESNQHMIKPLVLMGAQPYKKYRIFEKTLQ